MTLRRFEFTEDGRPDRVVVLTAEDEEVELKYVG
jgi:hypothetical protein